MADYALARIGVAPARPLLEMDSSSAPRSRRRQAAWRWLALAAVPAAYVASTTVATREVRPLWRGGAVDPTYPYLLNALLVAEGRSPALATHPGTPLQVMGAVVQRTVHALSGSSLGLRRHVLTDPETFVDAWRWLVVGLVAVACLAQGRAALALSGSLLCAVAAQAAALASAWAVPASLLVMCEALILAAGFAASALILRSMRRTPASPSPSDAVLLGLLVGVAIALKVLYASLALLPLIWLPRARLRALFAAALAAAFVVGVAPLWPRLPAVGAWLYEALVHTGAWGAGPAGFVVLATYPAAVAAVLKGEPLIHGVTALVAIAALTCRSREPAVVATRRCAWALVATAIATVLLAAKQSAAVTYYHMPVVSLAGLGLVLACRLFTSSAPGSRWPRGLLAAWLVASLAFHAWWLRAFVERRARARPAAEEAARAAAAMGGDRTLQGYSVSSLGSALTLANEWSGRRFSADLHALYPRAFSYDWAGLHSFGRPLAVAELDALRVDGDSFVLWDSVFWPWDSWDWFRGASVQPVGGGERDRLFRARLVPLEEGAAAAPPFAGLLILTGSSDRPSLDRTRRAEIEPLGAITRLAVLGTAGAARLAMQCRYTGEGAQTLRVMADGLEIGRAELTAAESWRGLSFALPARAGLIAVDVEYDRLFQNPAAARPRFPGYGDAERDVRWPAVQYRRLQVWRSAAARRE